MGQTRWRDQLAVAGLSLLATALALAARHWAGYPLNPSDERNWIAIAAQVAQGVDWPISGPLHFGLTQALARLTHTSHAQALATLGTLAIPLLLAAHACCYRLMGFVHARSALLALGTSSYFWAPLLESRPQQWGQALVLLCACCAWRALTPPTHDRTRGPSWWLLWCLLFTITSWTHVLSAALALALCGLLALGVFAFRPDHAPRLWRGLLAACPGLLILVLPWGPYRMMWFDIGTHQLRLSPAELAGLAAVVLLALAMLVWTLRMHGRNALHACLTSLESRPGRWVGAVATATVVLLALQASMLPPEAWVFYQGSGALFLLRQLGNLFFLALLLLGGLTVLRSPALRQAPQWQGQMALLACAGLLAAGALALSSVMLHTNWMLRVISYALPIAAPFAALGLARWQAAPAIKGLVLLLSAGLSLAVATLPQGAIG